MKKAILTIICLTYNHERYIRKTLEGFVNQETSYKYKVIVHDDASSDRTPQIIEEFAKKYPDIIFPIYQRENQYTKGKIFERFIQPWIDTKYIASCEGDDYWCDKTKIQQQIDYLENHSQCSLCVHNTALINEKGEYLNKNINDLNLTTDFYTNDVITNRYFHTSSYMFRSELRKIFPEAFYMKGVSDYQLMVFLSLHGYIHYIDKIMSCYRVGAVNSWTQRERSSLQNIIKGNAMFIETLKRMNEYTNFNYEIAFNREITYYLYSNLMLQKKYFEIIKNKQFIILFLKQCIPQSIKNRIKRHIFSKRVKHDK